MRHRLSAGQGLDQIVQTIQALLYLLQLVAAVAGGLICLPGPLQLGTNRMGIGFRLLDSGLLPA